MHLRYSSAPLVIIIYILYINSTICCIVCVVDLEKLLSSSISLSRKLKKKPPVVMVKIDLVDIKLFYLTVKGLEEWMDEDMVRDHFKAEAKGEDMESVVIKDGTAVIKFARPRGTVEEISFVI